MPNTIIYKIFTEKVLKSMTKYDTRSMIERHPQILYIDSNGPDFLFSSHIKPWESYKSHALSRSGSATYVYGINAFYGTAIECIHAQKHEDIKELVSVYLFSHLCRQALDKTTHPYIFYRTGSYRGVSTGLYHRSGSMMDIAMLEEYHGLSIRNYPCYEICTYDEDILKTTARIYVPAARKIYHREVKVYDIRETLDSWYDVQKLLYDLASIRYSLLKGFETPARKPWAASGNVVRPPMDEHYDVLNEEHAIWKHSCSNMITSNASFIDMFSEVIEATVHVVDKAYGCIEYGVGSQSVLELPQDAAYDTGVDDKWDMKHFDIICD